MLRWSLHLLLIGCLLGCPPSCWLREALGSFDSATGGEMAAKGRKSPLAYCCCGHRRSPSRPAVSEPAFPGGKTERAPAIARSTDGPRHGDDAGAGTHSCICGGAEVHTRAMSNADLLPNPLADCPAVSLVADIASAAAIVAAHWQPPDPLLSSGRDACRLYSVMRC
ncbi:MAG: hypothetical protein DCC68_22575 [Planctomycetota bacterium]|nr:MAG: hypothetical protein DCC68_22575 [Planctomycetota bacterium]